MAMNVKECWSIPSGIATWDSCGFTVILEDIHVHHKIVY